AAAAARPLRPARARSLEEPPDSVGIVVGELQPARREHGVELVGPGRPAYRTVGAREHPREGERRECHAARVRLLAQPVEAVEDAVVDQPLVRHRALRHARAGGEGPPPPGLAPPPPPPGAARRARPRAWA